MLQILVISLRNSKQRQKKVAAEMAKTQLAWHFLEAVDGAELNLSVQPYDPCKVRRLLGFDLTKKEIGCYLSHMNAWKSCVENDLPTIVFEDDFVINDHFEAVLQRLLDMKNSWGLVRLQALCESADELIQEFDNYRLVRNLSDPLGATAYIIQPVAAVRLLAHSSRIYEPLDHFLEHHEKHGLTMLAIKPYPVSVVDPTSATTTITDRPERFPVKGVQKIKRSIYRALDRTFSKEPWFPKK